MADDKRSECDCIYCKDMQEIQEFHDNGGYSEGYFSDE
jgi:hypothetical protein